VGIFGDEFEKQTKLNYPQAESQIIGLQEADRSTSYLKGRVQNEQ